MTLVQTRSGLFIPADVAAAVNQGVTVSGEDRAVSAAAAAPREPDTPQLLAAEQVGLFAYPHAPDDDSMKGHAA